MEKRSRRRRTKQTRGKTSSREFYYVGPAPPFQRRQHFQTIHTRGPLRNIQCEALDQNTQEQCKRQTVVGVEFVGNTSKNYTNSELKNLPFLWMVNLLGKDCLLLPHKTLNKIFLKMVPYCRLGRCLVVDMFGGWHWTILYWRRGL